jgi:hypothetical protein
VLLWWGGPSFAGRCRAGSWERWSGLAGRLGSRTGSATHGARSALGVGEAASLLDSDAPSHWHGRPGGPVRAVGVTSSCKLPVLATRLRRSKHPTVSSVEHCES